MINLNEGFSIPYKTPKFGIGEVVEHIRYQYRGLIVDFDHSCEAEQEWYQSNQTQPEQAQPWYHVLVDGNQHVTYVAQSNLQPDQTGRPVVHPLLNLFFYGLDEGESRYLRNDVPFDPGKPPDAIPPPPPEDIPPLPPNFG